MHLIRRTLERYIDLSDADWERIAPAWRDHAFSKGAFVCRYGEVEQRFYIVGSGVQRMSFPNDGEDHCIGFAYEHSWSGVYDSFVSRRPSRFDLVAVTDSQLWGIDYDSLQQLYRELPCMERFGRLILEELIHGRATREIEQLSLNAEERYHRLVQRSPQLLQLVPQKDIASYLRMSPETLSRLRAKRS